MVPARVTVRDLATELGCEVNQVQAVLRARQEPSSPEDLVSGVLAVEVGSALGVGVEVEPRDLALESLYEYETTGEVAEMPPGKACRLVKGVIGTLDELDSSIEGVAEHWSVARMPAVDRNVLRIGLYELEHERDTPVGVIVSEAVRLAQTYSTEKSGSFVNGVLARLAAQTRSD